MRQATERVVRLVRTSAVILLIKHMLVFCANLDTLKMEANVRPFCQGYS